MRFIYGAAALTVLALLGNSCFAQRGGPSPERMFRFLDRDGDGRLRGEELNRFPPMRNMLEEMEIDPEQGLTIDEFQDVAGEMRQRMTDRGGFRGRGGDRGDDRRGDRFDRGGDDSNNEDSGRDRRRSRRGGRDDGDEEERDRSERDADRGEDRSSRTSRDFNRSDRDSRRERRSDRQSPQSNDSAKTSRPRVTLDLPASYKDRDKNRDGQIGLYEWPQTDFAAFVRLDHNGDGFLTPRELTNSDRPAANTTVASVASVRTTSVSPTPSASGKPAQPQETAKNGDRYQKAAEYALRALDRNKNGQIEADEWKRSRSVRPLFKQAGVDISQTMSSETFIATYVRLRSQ